MNFSLRHFAEIVVVLLVVAIVIVFILLIPALQRISDFSTAGQQARQRQCQLLPVSKKELSFFRAHHVISARDVATFRKSEPKC